MNDLLGVHSVYKDGRTVGSLNVTQNGLMTDFYCECDYRTGEVVRLAGVSNGEYVKIGVLAPDSGLLKLKKSFTKSALSALRLEVDAGFFIISPNDIYNVTERVHLQENLSESNYLENRFDEYSNKISEIKPEETLNKPLEKPAVDENIPEYSVNNELETNAEKNVKPEKSKAENIQKDDEIPEPSTEPELDKFPSEEPAGLSAKSVNQGQWTPVDDPSLLFDDADIANACKKAKGALKMEKDGITLLAIPILPNEPFPMMPVFCFGDSLIIENKEFIVFKTKNGKFIV